MTGNAMATVLVVDDTSANIDILSDILQKCYQVKVALNGEKALEIACSENPPDLILLDIIMPGMDGYEVCEHLQRGEKTREIPVIFVTAKAEDEDEAKGLEAGAVDYIVKPLSPTIVRARVRTHLTISAQKRELKQALLRLQELERLRDNLVHMIVHDMRTPLMGITGYLDLVNNVAQTKLNESEGKFIKEALDSAAKLVCMVNDLLDVSRLEKDNMPIKKAKCNLRLITEKALKPLGPAAESVVFEFSKENELVSCDAALIERIITNLVANALKFDSAAKVHILLETLQDSARISVIDLGPGIAPEYHKKIFEKFGQVEMRENKQRYSTGLGLTFCKLAVEAHGGTIGVDSQVGKGSTFWFTLPGKLGDSNG